MDCKRHGPVLVGAALFLSACSFSSDWLLPSLTGEDPVGRSDKSAQQENPASAPKSARPGQRLVIDGAPASARRPRLAQSAPPRLGSTNFETPGVTAGKNTVTFVGH